MKIQTNQSQRPNHFRISQHDIFLLRFPKAKWIYGKKTSKTNGIFTGACGKEKGDGGLWIFSQLCSGELRQTLLLFNWNIKNKFLHLEPWVGMPPLGPPTHNASSLGRSIARCTDRDIRHIRSPHSNVDLWWLLFVQVHWPLNHQKGQWPLHILATQSSKLSKFLMFSLHWQSLLLFCEISRNCQWLSERI